MNRRPILILADIIKDFMGLNDDQIYIDNQDLDPNNAPNLFVTIEPTTSIVMSNNNRFNPDTEQQIISTNYKESYAINIRSKDESASIREKELVAALISDFSRNKQEEYFFQIAPVPPIGGINTSVLEGEGILTRYTLNITIFTHYNQVRDTLVYDNLPTQIESE